MLDGIGAALFISWEQHGLLFRAVMAVFVGAAVTDLVGRILYPCAQGLDTGRPGLVQVADIQPCFAEFLSTERIPGPHYIDLSFWPVRPPDRFAAGGHRIFQFASLIRKSRWLGVQFATNQSGP